MELILGLIFVTSWVMVAPKVLADAITTMRASKAGKWDVIDKDRDRRATRSERRSAAVAAVRKRRNREAGGSGAYEPGFRKYARDLYTGFWKRQCEKLAAKEKARPPYVYDPNRPGLRRRMRDGVVKRTSRLVDQAGGAGRLLIDPVGEKRQPADVAPRPGGRSDGGSAGTPVDPWLSAGDEPTVEIAADGPRTACPVCGDTLTSRDGGWHHPADSTCGDRWMDGKPDDPEDGSSVVHEQDTATRPQPSRQMDAFDRVMEGRADARANRRLPGMANCDKCGREVDIREMTPMSNGKEVQFWCDRHETPEFPADVLDTARQTLDELDPEGHRRLKVMDDVWEAVSKAHPDVDPTVIDRAIAAADRGQNFTPQKTSTTANASNSSNGGIDMSAGTIDLVGYNEAVAEHERALEQLRAQYAQACAFEQHITGIVGAVEAMDAGRSVIADALAPLAEGLEGSRYGGDATQGSAEATSAMTAGSIAEVQEHVEAAADRNQRWKQELAASIEGVQASLQHIKSQYGEAAATVQETGIDARALEDH